MSNQPTISPHRAEAMAKMNPACRLIDVREYPEWQVEHIAGATLIPLSTLGAGRVVPGADAPVVLLCRTGRRAAQAAAQLRRAGHREVAVIEGGLEAWKQAGLPVERGTTMVWSLERQVRFAAGCLVVTGLAGALLLSPYFLILSGAIGAGLMVAAATDTCAMGMVLARMPWNRAPGCDACECEPGLAL